MMKRMESAKPQARRDKRQLALVLALAAVFGALAGFYTIKADTMEVAARKRELPIYCVKRDDNKIAISFDAAWGGDQTEEILNILDEYGVKTTFFLVDIWTQRFPELVKEIARRGHEIGNHSTSHPQMSKLTRDQIARELKVMSDNAEALTGVRPTLFRPPYGDYDNEVVQVANEEGYQVIQWNVDSLDWKNRGVKELISQSTKKIAGGDIVLFHNDSKYILGALPDILKYYQEKGLEIVPVSNLLLSGDTSIDHEGRQHPAATKVPEV